MSTAVVQPLKWHGGKNYLAKWIWSLAPRHLNYVEPFAGGLAVLLSRDPDDERFWLPPHKGVSEVVNDLNGQLTNFWRVLQGEASFAAFHRIVEVMPFSGVEFDAALSDRAYSHMGEVGEAVRFFIRCRMSLAGRGKGFTGITKSRTRARMNNEVSAWLSCVDALPAVHQRLRRVLIMPALPALEVIRRLDSPQSLFYLDPPYLHQTRATTADYSYEMSEGDHRALLGAIRNCKGTIMLSGYASELYDDALRTWARHTFVVPNHASGSQRKQQKTEVLWCNF
jgi:DNA adenine methylase